MTESKKIASTQRSLFAAPVEATLVGGTLAQWLRSSPLIDEHTRQWLAVHVAWNIRAIDVITVVEAAMERHGRPGHIRSDNGPEFIAYAIQDWLK